MRDPQVRQSENDGLCVAAPPRSRDRRGYACATGNRGPSPGAGCSAGRCACPWPPLFSSSSGSHGPGTQPVHPDVRTASCQSSLPNRRGPEDPVAAVSPTFGRLFEGTEVTSAGQTAPIASRRQRLPTLLVICWHSARNLLASGRAWTLTFVHQCLRSSLTYCPYAATLGPPPPVHMCG